MITSVSVGTTAVQVLAAPPASPYKFVALGNNGAKTAYLKFTADTQTVSITNGIPLPAGGSIVCDQDSRRELFDSGVTAVCASGETTTISVQAF